MVHYGTNKKEKHTMKLYPIIYYEKTQKGRVYTHCYLIDEEKNIYSHGFSIKAPEDQFNRKDGRNKATGRAIQNLTSVQNLLKKINLHGKESIDFNILPI